MPGEAFTVSSHLGRLHILRTVAALGVFYHHLGQFSASALGHSFSLPASGLLWTGVDLFFVLSGFLMMWTTDGKPGGTSAALSFLLARVARIYPMYWVALGGAVFLASVLPNALPVGEQCSILCQVTLLPDQGEFLIGPAWTLSFEMTFYALFGVLMLLAPDGRMRALVTWTLIVCILGGFITNQIVVLHHIYTPLVLEFLAGVWIAVLVKRGKWLYGRTLFFGTGVLLLSGAAAFNYLSPALPSGIAE